MRWIVLFAASGMLAACGGSESPQSADATLDFTPSSTSTSNDAPANVETVDLSFLPAPFSEANYDAGRRQFRRCGSCHTVTADSGNRVGPNLYGLFGRQIGTAENFDYSTTLENADFIWTGEQLDAWLTNPREFLPGNRMSFVGLRNEEDRRDVIGYLMYETGYQSEN